MTTVAIGTVHDERGGSHSYEASFRALLNFDGANSRLIRRELQASLSKVDGLGAARNELCRQFLAAEDDWLFMVDRDMGFTPDALYRLLAVADARTRPIVGGLCFAAWKDEPDGLNGWRVSPVPMLMQWSDDLPGGRGLTPMVLYPADSVTPVAATGGAFLLIHRSVLAGMEGDWFTTAEDDSGRTLGEDISFCVRAGRAQFPVFVHTGVKTSHHKDVWLAEVDYWRSFRPPPAREPVAVVTPDEPSPEMVASLFASTGLATWYAGWHFAPNEPWWFLTGPDVRFSPGWLDHLQHVAVSYRAEVVQCNGMGVLARRELAEKFPGDWAGLVADARERGVYQVALGAEVEEVHGD